jgi:hypothetical protein
MYDQLDMLVDELGVDLFDNVRGAGVGVPAIVRDGPLSK